MSHTLDESRLSEVFSELEDNTERLTDWERSFVESVSDQWSRRGSLSERQLEILEKIYLRI